MSERQQLEEFIQGIRADVIDDAHGYLNEETEEMIPDFKENVFTRIVAGYLADIGAIEDATVCYYERRTSGGHIKVNGYHIDEDGGTVSLFVSIYTGAATLNPVSSADARQALNRSERFFRLAVKGHYNEMEVSTEQYDMAKSIYEVRNKADQVRIFLFADGLVPEKKYDSTDQAKNGFTFRYQIWDYRRIYRCVASSVPYEDIEIDFNEKKRNALSCLTIPQISDDYAIYLTVLPGDVLFDIYDEYRSRVLELNVRSFLQASGKINSGIRKTLKEYPRRFLAYNNGIVVTASGITVSVREGAGTVIESVRGLQIVNGGQTVASIYRAKKLGETDLSRVFVQAKIVVVKPETIHLLAPDITRYANSQNKINEADFSSNDPYHIELERISQKTWVPGEKTRWFYERARGQYQVAKGKGLNTRAQTKKFEETVPAGQKITKTDVAKYLNSWDGYPYVVSTGAQKNFVRFMDRIYEGKGREWRPDLSYYQELIAKAILFKKTDKIVKTKDSGITAYQANVVTYTVAYLAWRTEQSLDIRRIWEQQDLSKKLKALIRQWVPVIHETLVSSAGGRNVTEWCKNIRCWETVCSLSLPLPGDISEL